MNNVCLVGRLARDPEIRYSQSQTAVCRFSVAVSRISKDKGADFINCIAFGKTAETLSRYCDKGKRISVTGHIQTGSYQNQKGDKVYTTDVIADRISIIDWKEKTGQQEYQQFEGFEEISNDDVPF